MKNLKKINAQDLINMNELAGDYGYRIELAYARNDNLLFGEAIYHSEARLWLHRDLAKIVLEAANICTQQHNVRLILYDGLRTVDAQIRMLETQRVKDNPHWLEEPSLLSSPGAGGHPRGMAVDLGLETMDGTLLDMGTPFDYLAEDSSPEHNPAHREYPHAENILQNRKILKNAMLQAAEDIGLPLLPIPQEWWDFRFPRDIIEQYAPLHDADLPSQMRCVNIAMNINPLIAPPQRS